MPSKTTAFELHAQAIVPLTRQTENSSHYELLLRMRDDDNNLVYPATFLPAATRYNLMLTLDRWVFRHAIEWLNLNSGC